MSANRLRTVDQCLAESAQRRRLRDSAQETGVECPDCGKELVRQIPPLKFGSEVVFFLATCGRCLRRVWLPDE